MNHVQMFAARYYLCMTRRVEKTDFEHQLRRQLWFTHPDRYNQLLGAGVFADDVTPAADPDEDFEDADLDEYDRYFDNLEAPHMMSGAELMVLQHGGDWI